MKKNVELLETFNFKQIVGLDWPVELKDGIIEKKYNKEISALNASFSFKNFMNKKIIYTEWELICKDILDRSLDTVVVKSDSKIAPQESTGIDSISLPEHTRYFIPKLLAVVYDTKEIVKMTERVLINEVTDRNLINRLQSFDEELLKNYQKDKNLPDIPKFVYERYTNGIWTCAFCGTRNASEHSECHICEIGTDLQEECTKEKLQSVFVENEIKQQDDKQPNIITSIPNNEKADTKNLSSDAKKNNPVVTWLIILIGVGALLAISYLGIIENNSNKNSIYNEAHMLEQFENFDKSYDLFISLGDYKDASERAMEVLKKRAYKRKFGYAPPKRSGFNFVIDYDSSLWE